jgi:hypothetical protein
MLKRGRVSQAQQEIASVPIAIDVRAERPAPPAHFTEQERELWNQLTAARRPGWYGGALELLESYCTLAIRCRQLEAALRKLDAAAPRADRLARQHRQTLALAASLAGRLRLTPNSRLDRRQRQEGDDPMTEQPRDQAGPRLASSNDDDLRDANGERSFQRLRERTFGAPAPEPVPPETKAASKGGDVPALGGASVSNETSSA